MGWARTSSDRRGRRFRSGRLCAAVGARRSSLCFSVSRECGDCYGGALRVGRIGWGGSGGVGRWNVYGVELFTTWRVRLARFAMTH